MAALKTKEKRSSELHFKNNWLWKYLPKKVQSSWYKECVKSSMAILLSLQSLPWTQMLISLESNK